MLTSGEKDSKSLFAGLLPHLTKKRRLNAAPWHQLYSQGDYHDPFMDVEHSSIVCRLCQDGMCLVGSLALCLVKPRVAI